MLTKINKTENLKDILGNHRFSVDYYQREYRWGKKQIEQLIDDLTATFKEFYDPDNHGTLKEVSDYGYYFMGTIICTAEPHRFIIDGQQRLTTLTLLLMYLNRLQKEIEQTNQSVDGVPVAIDYLIFSTNFGTATFNLDIEDRRDCMDSLLKNSEYEPTSESNKNILERYRDIEELFPEELQSDALPFFITWLIERVLLLEIETPSEDEAHTMFLTMNDRGLSLNSAEMLKAYIIQQVAEANRAEVNKTWQLNINRIKAKNQGTTSGSVKSEDVEFISLWLRAKYAKSLREGNKGSTEKDFELLGDKFHTWVRQNARTELGLLTAEDFRRFVVDEMTAMTDLYLRVEEYSENLTCGYESVFYNSNRDLSYQTLLIMAAVDVNDSVDIIDQKIKLVAAFVDIFASIRIFNSKKVNWNTNKHLLFKVIVSIRDQELKDVGMHLFNTLEYMPEKIEGVLSFRLNQYTKRYMLHLLARLTSHINSKMGYVSEFEAYVDRTSKITYDIEHILPDDFPTYQSDFNDEEDFENHRQKFGNLLLLTRDRNRSYKGMAYCDKVKRYLSDNILARSLNPGAYQNNPHFLKLVDRYGFHAIDRFDKENIKGRQETYYKIASDIWNAEHIKNIVGNWTEIEIE